MTHKKAVGFMGKRPKISITLDADVFEAISVKAVEGNTSFAEVARELLRSGVGLEPT